MTSVILVQHNNIHLTREAIRSFISFHPAGYEFIVVDNGSTDGDLDDLRREFPGLQLIRNNENVGFGVANNQGATVAKGEILFFLNNDTVTTSEMLSAISLEFDRDPQIGVIGPKLLDPDGCFQLSSGELPSFWREMVDKFLYNWLTMDPGRRGIMLRRHLEEKELSGG
jgi:GT2 family glycosyltransferase